MLIVICGDLGGGKTLYMVYLLIKNSFLNLFGNMKSITLKNYRVISPFEIFDLPEKSIIALDEGYIWLESRSFQSSLNQLLSYFYFEARKKETMWIITVQLLRTMDIRFRKMIDELIYAQKVIENNEMFFKYKVYTRRGMFELKMNSNIYEKVFKYYDTNELISPIANVDKEAKTLKSMNPQLFMKNVKLYAEEIMKLNKGEDRKTKEFIKFYLMGKNVSSFYVNDVYHYCKINE